jgi:glycosyltransferase involved in cell wall biosynthesis
VYQGCHPIFKQSVSVDVRAQVRQKYNLPGRYILNVGTLESRKNAHQLVKAVALLPREARIPLVLVGRATAYKEEIVRTAQERGIEGQLIFLHQASFQDFPALYQGAEVFVYPSLFEGFGIPLVEAIESGVPVITSTGSCFQEAAGDGALYADPHNAEALAHQLARTLQDATLRSQLVEAGRRYIQQFQPAVIAQRLQDVYRG